MSAFLILILFDRKLQRANKAELSVYVCVSLYLSIVCLSVLCFGQSVSISVHVHLPVCPIISCKSICLSFFSSENLFSDFFKLIGVQIK